MFRAIQANKTIREDLLEQTIFFSFLVYTDQGFINFEKKILV